MAIRRNNFYPLNIYSFAAIPPFLAVVTSYKYISWGTKSK
jgi:hypothetical protein